MITLPRLTPAKVALAWSDAASWARLLGLGISDARPVAPPAHDPAFLPDFTDLTPDQAQELRYGLGRSAIPGSDR